jgi:NAD(P)H-dependent flavin oxidoreductase YrpB (nitropropane dioxygenase family)
MRDRFVTEGRAEALEFPLQASLAGPLWQVPDEAARVQLMPFWAGQAVALVRELPAVQLVDQLAAEARAVLARST